ncbi:MAG: type II toxin-antitoxin system VapC family toxin [Candidatus Nanopelagicales bacterium]
MIVYLDASVAVTAITDEPGSAETRSLLDGLTNEAHLVLSGRLLETEMRRTARRLGISMTAVDSTLDALAVVEHERSDFRRAGTFQMRNLGSLDALHLATALRVQADVMLTRDRSLAAACEAEGLTLLDA